MGAEWPLPSAGGLGGSWKLLTMDRDLMVAQFSTPSLPPSLVSAGGPRPGQEELRSAPAKPASQQVGGQGDPAAWSANCPLGLPCTERAPGAAPRPLAEQSAETAPRTEGCARLCMDQPTVGVRATPAGGGDGSALRELHAPPPPHPAEVMGRAAARPRDTPFPLGRKLGSCLLRGRNGRWCGCPWRRPNPFPTSPGASGCCSRPRSRRTCSMVSPGRGPSPAAGTASAPLSCLRLRGVLGFSPRGFSFPSGQPWGGRGPGIWAPALGVSVESPGQVACGGEPRHKDRPLWGL